MEPQNKSSQYHHGLRAEQAYYELRRWAAGWLHRIADRLDADGVLDDDHDRIAERPLSEHTLIKIIRKAFTNTESTPDRS